MNDTDLAPLLEALRRTAVTRDREGGHAGEEKQLIREAGLLRMSIPEAFGGWGRGWPEVLGVVRRIAAVDSSLAHLFAFHHLQVVTVLIYGSPDQQQRWLSRTVREGGWWGNAVNMLDVRLVAERDGAGGYRLRGTKGFCSGSRGSSYMTLTAKLGDGFALGVVETDSPGLAVQDDWDPIGQRQTDSGTVVFDGVALHEKDVLRRHDATPGAFHTLRTCFGQIILVNLYLGIAKGALAEARAYAQGPSARPWIASGVDRATEDPYTLHRVGDMHVQIAAATALADRAATLLQQSLELGPALTARQRAETSVAIAEAKVVAHRAGLFASQELFEVVGARGTTAALGYDRFWRNVRTHTLHDPVDYKLNLLGRWALNDEWPSPTLYA